MQTKFHTPDGPVDAEVVRIRDEGRYELKLEDGTVLPKVWPNGEEGGCDPVGAQSEGGKKPARRAKQATNPKGATKSHGDGLD